MATQTTTVTGGIAQWFEERVRATALFQALLHVEIPREAKTYYLGGITLFLFMVQVVTGTLLSLYYKPTPDAAYDSVKYITSVVEFGWLVRSVHHWAANGMMIFMVLHVARIFVQGVYKYPRELIWIFGGLLLAVTIGFGFTGYLLPWDQKAYWATVVGTEIAGAVPFVGDSLLQLLRGGTDVTGATLTRFFGVHVLVLPILLALLLVAHLTVVHQLGLANPTRPSPRPGRPQEPGFVQRWKPFWPHYVLDEVIAWAVLLGALVVLSSVLPAGLEEQADPLKTPEHVKPEWYFLAVFQLLKVVPAIPPGAENPLLTARDVGILVPMFAMVILVFLPLIDNNPAVAKRKRPVALTLGLLIVIGMIVLTYYGAQ
jgi:quinol-cytochrome oxidoreductase complex cytochrome b subunit